MRFKKRPRQEYEITHRKRLAAARSQRRQCEQFPLIAPLIAAAQPDIGSVMATRVALALKFEQEARQRRASRWRVARRRLYAMEPGERVAILSYWNQHKWLPGDPTYFLDMLHMIDKGRLVREGQTFKAASVTVRAAQAVDAVEIEAERHRRREPTLL